MPSIARLFFCFAILLNASVAAAAECGMSKASWKQVEATLRKNTKPVVVVFCADWAPHCPAYINTVNSAACKRPGVAFFLLDLDVEAQKAKELSLTGIPTTLIFHGYKEVKRALGAASPEKLESIFMENGVNEQQAR